MRTREGGSRWTPSDDLSFFPGVEGTLYAMKPDSMQNVVVGDVTLYGDRVEGGESISMVIEKSGILETSLPALKLRTCVKTRFGDPSNGGRAGGTEARGSCDDEAPFVTKAGVVKPSTLVNLNRDRQILTRLQSLRIAQTFQLLALPAELRLMIYEFCFDFSGIDKWFDKFWQILLVSSRPRRVAPPLVYKHTPAVLLLCKQVYFEAREVLKKQSISFHHGLLDIFGLDNLMNTEILKNISSLTIDAVGHAILPQDVNLIGPSWRGHLDLIVDISNILSTRHRLKTFTLDLTDTSIKSHVHDCWDRPIRCDYRDQLAEALEHLRKIRSVGKVNLIGIPKALVAGLKARMECDPLTFLSLPGEIRNAIYKYAADWSDISKQLTRTLEAWFADEEKQKRSMPPYPSCTTPTILLLNKQIHAEAKSILYAKPLVVDMPANPGLAQSTETLNALKLITPRTLANVRCMKVSIESWEWVYALDRVIPQLATYHKLKAFKFTFRDRLKRTFLDQGKKYPDHTLHLSLSGLARMRGIGFVEFGGDLPDVYTAPLKAIMESPKMDGEELPVLKAVSEKGEGKNKVVKVVEIDEYE